MFRAGAPLAASARRAAFAHPRRHASRLSPRTVLKFSGKSYASTAIALAAVGLYFYPAERADAAKEAVHATTSVDWAADQLAKRAWAYSVLAKLPLDYKLSPADLAAAANANAAAATANRDVPANQVKLSAFGREIQFDLGDIDGMINDAKTSIAKLVDSNAETRFARSAVDSATKTHLDDANRLPFARPEVGTRAFAWLIDSAFVGLVAAPFWGTFLYGAVASAAWLSKDYLFTLLPVGNGSPGNQLLGLEKVHVATATAVRPATAGATPAKAVDVNDVLASELPSVLGHNTLRFLTWCAALGPVSSLATLAWAGYALFNGVEETMVAWDKFAGVQVVHRADLEHFATTGSVPIRTRQSSQFAVDVDLVRDGSATASTPDQHRELVGKFKLNDRTISAGVEVIPGGGGNGRPNAKIVVNYVRDGVASRSELELPEFVTIKDDTSSRKN
ncbi:hypothetical protein H9P43_005989 [Blastocladiella emersonii ATCC 22665]|nr:hypothetical protein H9P43_005989 [Blastocladiella emersonii ATCC 22665]